jgi:hypothetical protein
MRWTVIYGYEVPGGALDLSSTKLPRPWSPWESSPSRENPHGRTGNWIQDLMISSQKLGPLDHEAGLICNLTFQKIYLAVTQKLSFLCFVDDASLCVRAMKPTWCTVSSGLNQASWQSTKTHITYQSLHIQGVLRLYVITAGGDFVGLCDEKSSYKHVSDFGRLRSYDSFETQNRR